MRMFFHRLKLQTKIVLLTCFIFALAITAENLNFINIVNNGFYATAVNRAENVADIAATSPIIIDALLDPSAKNMAEIQNYTLMLSKIAQVEFVVVINMKGIRQSHPHTYKIGKHIEGSDTDNVLYGQSYISTAKGTLGASLRVFRPIYAADGSQIGGLVVGIMTETIDLMVSKANRDIIWSLLFVLSLGIVLAMLLANSVKRILHGLEPNEIANILEERNTILRTVRDGIIAINLQGDVTLINDEAKRILKISEDDIGADLSPHQTHKVYEYIPNTRLDEIIKTGEAEYDCEQRINNAVILTNRAPLKVNGNIIGAIASFRDMTEIKQLAENLTGVNRYADALRSQSHEFLNKLHVIYGLLYNDNKKELLAYLEKIIGTQKEEEDIIYAPIKDPVIAGFLTSKFSRARELGVQLSFKIKGTLLPIENTTVTHGLITILGNLIDNALDAVQPVEEKNIDILLTIDNECLVIEINDSGIGIDTELIPNMFVKGYSIKGEGRGIGLYLVLATVDELSGHIEVDSEVDMGLSICVSIPTKNLYKKEG